MSPRASRSATKGPLASLDGNRTANELMRRAFGLMFVGAAVFGAIWLALPDGEVPASPLLAGLLVVGGAAGVALLALGRRFADRYYSALLAFATASVSGALYLTGDPQAGTVMLYLWATPYAFWFFSLRRAIAHSAYVALACALTLTMLAPTADLATLATTEYLGTWLHVVVTIVVVGTLVRWLATRLGSYGDRLARRASAQTALVDLGARALAGTPVAELHDKAVAMMEDLHAGTFAAVHVLDPHGDPLPPVTSAGWPLDAAATAEQARLAADLAQPVVSPDLAAEARFDTAVLRSGGMSSSAAVPIRVAAGVYGVLSAYSTAPDAFSVEDVSWLQATANVLASAIDRSTVEERMRHLALHDPLTGLPNRALFLDRVQQALQAARRTGAVIGVLMLDLDGFKVVNDSLGHAAGDELLIALAPRLTGAVRSHDTVARLGGDEFVLLFSDLGGDGCAREIAERVLTVWQEPVVVNGRPLYVSGSIGIAVARAGASTPDDLLADADAAMYQAKARGRGCVEVYGDDLRALALERLEREGELRGAVEREEMRLHYQPVVDLGSGRVVGVEALLRWQHPQRGLLSPAEFVALAEDTGSIVPIGRWSVEQAVARLAEWLPMAPGPGFRVTVNVSGRQLAERGFADDVAAVLARYDVPAEHLGVEVTERVLLAPSRDVLATLQALDVLGVTLVLDDFGTGYSSLGHLKRFPVDVLKLDRAFVAELDTGVQDVALARAIVDMANALQIPVVAEGVERAGQVERLRELGCELGQGFYWAAPGGPDVVTALLAVPVPSAP